MRRSSGGARRRPGPDLLFGSKVRRRSRPPATRWSLSVRAEAWAVGGLDVLVVDLDDAVTGPLVESSRWAGAARGADAWLLAHVEPEVRERALAAGFDHVVPRSRMTARAPRWSPALRQAGRAGSEPGGEGPRDVGRGAARCRSAPPSGPAAQRAGRARRSGAPAGEGRRTTSSWRAARRGRRRGASTSADGGLRVVDRRLVAAAQRATVARTTGARSRERLAASSPARARGRRGAPKSSTRNSRMPGRRRLQRDALDVPERRRRRPRGATSSACTALKPIVTCRTRSGSPPSPATIERRTASSRAGRSRRPAALEVARAADSGWASTAASGRWTSAMTPTTSRPRSRASARSWMSRIAELSARPAEQQPARRRSTAPAPATRRRTPSALVVAARQREVDPGVDRVGREVQHQRRVALGAVARRSTAAAAAGDAAARSSEQARRRRTRAESASAARRGMRSVGAARLGLRGRMRRRVTFSRNVTLSLSRTCVSHCKYCAFQTHQPHLHDARRGRGAARPRGAARRQGAARPHRRRARRTTRASARGSPSSGFDDFVAYVAWCCERALERGLLPHTNLGALARDELARLREVTASQGLMLESLAPDLVAHQGSPTKDPALRLRDDPRGGRAADPVHERDPRRASARRRRTASRRSRRWPRCTPSTAICRRSSCRTSSRTGATTARSRPRSRPRPPRRFWRTGLGERAGARRLPAWAPPVSLDDMERPRRDGAASCCPDVGVQVPPNLADWWPELVAAGATDLGGLSANGDHISPEHPFPSPHQVRKRLARRRRRADRAAVRLPAVPRRRVARRRACSTSSRRSTGASSRAAARAARSAPFAISADLVGPAIEKARDGARA